MTFSPFFSWNHCFIHPTVELGHGRGDTLLVGTSKSLYALTDTGVKKYLLGNGFLTGRITAIDFDADKRVWVGTANGLLVLAGETLTPGPSMLAGSSITSLACGPGGIIWIGTGGNGLAKLRNDQVEFIRTPMNGLATNFIRSILQVNDTLWVGTDGAGLERYSGDRFTLLGRKEFSGDGILSLCRDREENLWIGTYSGGLTRMKRGCVSSPILDQNLTNRNISCILEDSRGRKWVGLLGGALNMISGQHVEHFYGPAGNFVRALYEDLKGNIWIGTTDAGAACYDGKQFRWYTTKDGLGSDWITAIMEDADGRLLIGTRTGELKEFRNGRFAPYSAGGTILQYVTNLLRAPDGTLWVVTQGSVLHRIRGTSYRKFTHAEGLTGVRIEGVYDFGDDGFLWVATVGGGLQILRDTTFRTITTHDGLFDNTIHCLIDDGNGNYWMSSNRGIASVQKKQIHDFIEGKRQSFESRCFDAKDGMPSRECNGGSQPAGYRMRDGALWFPTVNGIALLNPRKVPLNLLPPPVCIEEAKVNRERVDPYSAVIAPPGGGDLEFHFVALSLTSPERVRYRYTLEGFNDEWVDAQERRVAYYTNISPGSYRFRVKACNNDGVWGVDEAASIDVQLLPHFYQTIPFYIVVFILAVSLGAGIQIFYKKYQDRGRVAAELRSQLALTQLEMLRSQLKPHFLFNTLNTILVYTKEDPAIAATMVEQLSRLLRVATDSLQKQEIPLREEMALLDAYLGILQVRFEDRLRVQRDIDPTAADGLVPTLVLQPIVENAITHAFTRTTGDWKIEIRARRNNGLIDISVSDNGSGFPNADLLDSAKSAGIGLQNTHARLHYLYGSRGNLILTSGSETPGATVRLVFPFHTINP